MPPKHKRVKFSEPVCTLCDTTPTSFKQHMLANHLPWFINPVSACADCQVSEGCGSSRNCFHGRHRAITGDLVEAWCLRMNGLFHYLAQRVGLESPEGLLDFVISAEGTPTHIQFNNDEIPYLKEFDTRASLEPLADGDYSKFPPRRLICLSNHVLFAKLVTDLDCIVEAQEICSYLTYDGGSPSVGHPRLELGIIDSHFHLDKVLLRCQNLTKRSGLKEWDVTPPVHLSYAIANYVFPENWSKIDYQARDECIKVTLGFHPRRITMDNYAYYLQRLEELLQRHPLVVGIGEIGLDYSPPCSVGQKKAQRLFLHQGLLLTKRFNKVLVLHVRDDSAVLKAQNDTLEALIEAEMHEHPIHRHCFTGDDREYKKWQEALPNCYFSISPKSVRTPSTVAWLKDVEKKDRIILETDADYLGEKNPWCVYNVAVRVAQYLDMPLNKLVKLCNKNAARLYSLTW